MRISSSKIYARKNVKELRDQTRSEKTEHKQNERPKERKKESKYVLKLFYGNHHKFVFAAK